MLHGAALVRLLEPHRGDDAGLRIAPAHDADAGRLAQRRGPPVGGHEQCRAQRAWRRPAREIDADAMLVDLEARGRLAAEQRDARPDGGGRQQGVPQLPVLDDVGGGLAAIDGVVVGHEHRAEGVLQARVGDVDGGDGLGVRGDRRPHAERRQHALGAGRKGEGAGVIRPGARPQLHPVHDGDAGVRPQRVGERAGEREAGRAAAGNHHVVALGARAHCPLPRVWS